MIKINLNIMNSSFKLPLSSLNYVAFFALFFFCISGAKASQVAGGNFEYECAGPNTFNITLRLFQDCGGTANLPNNINIQFTSPCGGNFNRNFTRNNQSILEISQVCQPEIPNTTCNGGSLPGMEEHVYTAQVNLPLDCDSWTMSYDVCCRNPSNNIANPLTDFFEVNATLNNDDFDCPDINSPIFGFSGTPYVCADEQVNFNPSVIDPDGDTLFYQLVPPASTTWAAGFSETQPFGAGVPVTFNQNSGQLTFTPDAGMTLAPATWNIAIRVCKISNNDTVGCTTRDFQFVVQNCNNTAPYLETPGITNTTPGVTILDSTSLRICGESLNSFSFDLVFGDTLVQGQASGDQITITSNVANAFPNANITITNGNPATINVTQNTNIGNPGLRQFTVQVEDDACPIPGINTYQFDVEILPTVQLDLNEATHCTADDTTFVNVASDSNYSWNVVSGDPINLGVNFSDTTVTGQQNIWVSPSQTTIYEVVSGLAGPVCTTRDTLIIYVSEIDTPITQQDTTICENDSLVIGSVTKVNETYLWNTGDTTSTITAYGGNTYQLTITDELGCTKADTVVIGEHLLLPHDLGNDSALCFGDTLALTPGPGFDQYLWNDSSTNEIFNADTTGIYSVTTTDSNACVQIDSVEVYFSIPPQFNLRSDTALCEGDDITIGPGAGFDSYLWSTAATTPTIVAADDTFWVEIADTLGCSTSDTVVLSVRTAPQAQLDSIPILCVRDSAQIGPLNDIFPDYAWNTGDSVPYIYALPGNEYQLTVTDSFGCEFADTLFAQSLPDFDPDLGADTGVCPGNSIIVTPGPDFVSYNWSTNSTDSAITLNQSGTYRVTTVDTNGCTYVDSINFTVFDTIPFSVPFTDTLVCPYDTLPIDITNPGYVEYFWNSTLDSLPNTDLYVTEHPYVAVDSNGCQTFGIIRVLDLNLPPLLSNFTEVCPNDSSTILASSGYDTYNWSNGASGNPATVFGVGQYTVTATDSLGCIYEASTNAVSFAITPVDLGPDDTLCLGSTKLLNAGANYANYDWDDTTSNPVRIVDSTGSYFVEVTDNFGCRTRDTVDIYFSPGPLFSLGNDTALCPGDDLRLEMPPGFEPYAWSTGDSTETIFASDSTFWGEATDSTGCKSRDTIVISVRTPPTVDLGPDYHYCRYTTFSEILNPGPQYDAYQWHNAATTQIINFTEADSTIWVTVFDVWGCEASDTMEVIRDPLPNVNLGGLDTICAGSTRPLNAGTSGGSITNYAWSTSATSQTINITTSPTITGPDVQNYIVTVTDTNDCERADTFTLVTMPLPRPELGNDTAFCTGDAFSHVLDPGNFVSYNWNTGSNQPTITVGAVDSLYSVQVTDSIGCTASDDIVVTENPLPNPILPPDTNICDRNPFNIVLNPGGFASYSWSTGSVAPALLVTTGGTYEVTVSDVNGCENDTSINIIIQPTPDPDLGPDIVVCEDSVFNITLDGTPLQVGPIYTYNWNTGASDDTIVVNEPGRYTVTVQDQGNGCRDSSSIRINSFERVIPDLGPGGVICDGEAKLLDPMVSGTGYSFNWNTGESTRRILINQPGTYIVEMNAVNGTCRNNRDTVVFEQGTLPVIELGEDIRACEGQTVRLLDNHTPFPDAEYIWQDTINRVRFSATRSGRYRVRVTNTCGTVTDEIQILFDDCYNLYIPNAFTPNGDGINDEFKPQTDQPIVDYAMVIYNRWGRAVFKTNDINVGWDGTRNGGALPQDVYIYRISYVSGLDERRRRRIETGNVTLIKGATIDQ